MCGIAGYISLTTNHSSTVIQKMTDSISHRGPDGWGHKIIDNVAIGHRRLSIIDLASGSQPMSNNNENLWITYNGELYNYKQLKNELSLLGHKFVTTSDTEVIIYAYQQWGAECVKRFRGMFAFGILDLLKKEIFIARDHFGIKPLYIYSSKNCIAFGSELQQFGNLPNFEKELDITAIDQYLMLQYVPAPLTVFRAVKKVKPAHYLTIKFNGLVSDQVKYWDVNFNHKQIKTENEWIDATDEAIKSSVKAHLVSDVPFGAFLSGGVDSSLVVKYMSSQLNRPVQTFSIGFKEQEYNELPFAEIVAKKFGTKHHTEIIEPDALSILPDLVKHYGEPFGDSSAIPTYYLCRLTRKHVTMALSGDGGDEAFAGYDSYINWMKFMPLQYRKGIKKKIYPYLEKFISTRYPKKDTLDEWLKKINYLDVGWRNRLWKDEYKEFLFDSSNEFKELFNSTSNNTLANKVQFMDLKTYLPQDILTKVDIASMIHSLEVRTPLVDKEIWELAVTIPEEFNINNNNGTWQGKQLLKKLMQRNFDSDFVNRKKQGFAVPLSKWFSNKDQLRQILNESVLSSKSNLSELFNQNTLIELLNSQNTGAIWLMLFLDEWLYQFNNKTNELHL